MAIIAQKGVQGNKIGNIKLVKKLDEGKVYVLKEIERLDEEEVEKVEKYILTGELDDQLAGEHQNNIMREMQFLIFLKKMGITHKNFIQFKKCVYNKRKKVL
jgi:ribosomal protein S13